LVVRTAIFLLDSLGHSSGQLAEAALAFLASVLGTCVTVAGLWLTKAHNDRTESRLALETVATGLNLIGQGDGYAPSAKVAGALATLIHLDQPVIAIRALRTAWLDNAVDAETATWLIGEVLKSGTPGSQLEAARLLYARADKLTELRSDGSLDVHWPYWLYENWPADLHLDVRGNILRALVAVLLSKELSVWQRGDYYYWVIGLLDEAIQREKSDPEAAIGAEAGRLQTIVLGTIAGPDSITWLADRKEIAKMRENAAEAVALGWQLLPFGELEERLRNWAGTVPRASRLRRGSPESRASRAPNRRWCRRGC
jgi:hypothetical protein